MPCRAPAPRHVDHRLGLAALAAREQRHRHGAHRYRKHGHAIARCRLAQFLQPEHQSQQRGHDQHGRAQVPGTMGRRLPRRHQPPRRPEQGQHHGDVDQEHRAPPEILQQHAADHRPQGRPAGGDGGPYADGQGAFARVREHMAQDRQGGGHHQRRADRQQAARDDQQGGRGRIGHAQRGRAECRQPAGERGARPPAVAQGAHGRQQAGDHQRIGVDDPQLFRCRGMQVVGQAGQCRIQYSRIDRDQEEGAGDDGQHQPTVLRPHDGMP
ncbi:Uncharacterised protein [Bordetella pertussis]|nr:Uncharacterised protein [Bordetella pertussis]